MLRRLMANSLFQDTAILVFGTAGGRLILLLAMPAATRLYDPEDFRLLAVFVALVSTISVAACLRFEIAIPLAENDDDAANLLVLALVSVTGMSLGVLAFSSITPQAFAEWLGVPEIGSYLWLVPVGIFLMASYSALQFWATRMRRFGIISRTRVGQTATGVMTMLGLGWIGLAPLGLLLGNMLTVGAGGVSLAVRALRQDRAILSVINWRSMVDTARRFRRYPIYSTPEALANVTAIQMPILMIAAMTGDEAGQLFLVMQIMAAPMTLLGASVGQVFASRAQEELRNGTLNRFTVSMMRRLFLIGLGPMAAAALLGPPLFPVVFGDNWARAGVIVAWIAPCMLLQLTVSPVSMGLHVTGHQRAAMALQVVGLALRVGAVALAASFPVAGPVEAYTVSGAVFYLVYAITVKWAVRSR